MTANEDLDQEYNKEEEDEESFNYEENLGRKEHYDEDQAYDEWRDYAGERLYDEVKALLKGFYNSKRNTYYSGKENLDKLKRHLINDIEYIKEEDLK